MKQHEIIRSLKENATKIEGLDAMVLIGSFARKEEGVHSDIDVSLIVNDGFSPSSLPEIFQKFNVADIVRYHYVALRNKMVIYLNDMPKLELLFYKEIDDFKRNFIGSEIPQENIKDAILFDRNGDFYLKLSELSNSNNLNYIEEVPELVDKFIYEFESASNAHKRSDAFHFYFFYNIALHCYIRLLQISRGDERFNYLPKKVTNVLLKNEDERQQFYSLSGSLFLPEANKKKRALLDAFYVVLEDLKLENSDYLRNFCEYIYERDYLWNFRDAGEFNPNIKKGRIYRTATLTNYQDETFFKEFLQNRKINRVVDLRADREIAEMPYKENAKNCFQYVHAPFDPWNQSIEFKALHHYGTNVEIAYRFFVLECKPYIKRTFETILSDPENATAIHCFAGKDRTGFIMILIGLILDTSIDYLLQDYMASEMDVKKEHFDIYINNIQEQGGIKNYLLSCGLSEKQIESFIKTHKND